MRALLRHQPWRSLHRPFIRFQHDLPHKEYFQTPGQTPLPDLNAYIPPPPPPPPPPPTFPSRPSYFRRAFRSITWATLFGAIGVASGVGLITWDYLQPPFEPGSEEDQEMMEEIETILDTHPLVEGLRSGGWTENPQAERQPLRFLQTLSGTQGLTLRSFQQPSSGYSILVFYTGAGVEGWPDVIHGGAIMTLFNEAASLHSQNPQGASDWRPPYQVSVDFMEPLRPGEVYSILMSPPNWSQGIDPKTGTQIISAVVAGVLTRMELPPEIITEEDAVAKTSTHNITIPTRGDGLFAQAMFSFSGPLFDGEDEEQQHNEVRQQGKA